MSTLLDLPVEIIATVLRHLGNHKDIVSTARTCRRLHQLSEPYLYAFLDLNFEQAIHLFHSLSPETGLGLLSPVPDGVEIHPPLDTPESSPSAPSNRDWRHKVLTLTLNDDRNIAAGYFVPWIEQLTCLEELKITSPYWHFSDFCEDDTSDPATRYDALGRPRREDGVPVTDWVIEQARFFQMFEQNSVLQSHPSLRLLPSLRSCHIKYNELNGQLWFIDFEPIFFSVTITHLILDGCLFHQDDFSDYVDENEAIREGLRYSSALQHLVLLNCNLDPISMKNIMMIPKSLRQLGLDQTDYIHHEMAPRTSLFTTAIELVQILELQSQSLEELCFGRVPDLEIEIPELSVGLHNFQSLKVVCLSSWQDFLDFYDRAEGELKTLTLPQSLRTLRFGSVRIPKTTMPSSSAIHKKIQHQPNTARRFKGSFCPDLETIIIPLTLQRSERIRYRIGSSDDAQWLVDAGCYQPVWQDSQNCHDPRLLEPKPRFSAFLDPSTCDLLRDEIIKMREAGLDLHFIARIE